MSDKACIDTSGFQYDDACGHNADNRVGLDDDNDKVGLHDDDEVVVLLAGSISRVADMAAGHIAGTHIMNDVDGGKVDDCCKR